MSLRSTDLPSHLLILCTLQLISATEQQSFSHVRAEPLRVLSEVVGRFISMLGVSAKDHAELCGRSSINTRDMVSALAGLGFDQSTLQTWLADAAVANTPGPGMAYHGSAELDELCNVLTGLLHLSEIML